MWLVLGCLSAALSVAGQAATTHLAWLRLDLGLIVGLESGLRQHMFHSLALILVGFAALHVRNRRLTAAGALFATGIVLFSGALYLRALFGASWLAQLVPLGGISFMLGWLLLALALWPRRRPAA